MIPGANWGSLGPNGQRRWTKRRDGLVGGSRVRAAAATHKRPGARDLSSLDAKSASDRCVLRDYHKR